MAITIDSQPDNTYIQPGWNKLQYLASSTSTAQPGFKIICKVYTDPSGSNTLRETLNLYVIPGDTAVYVDIRNIVQSFINDTYSILSGATVDEASQTHLSIIVRFQEYYSGSVQGANVNSDIIFVARQAFPVGGWVNGVFQNYMLHTTAAGADDDKLMLNGFENDITVTGSTNPTLTTAQKYKTLVSGAKEQIRFNISGTGTMRIYAALYDENFAVTDSDYIEFTSASGTMFSLDIGTSELSGHTWIGSGLTPTSTDKYMALWVYNPATGFALSQAKLFELDWCDYFGYTRYEVHWLNRFGGFDSWTFDKASKHETMVEQATYKNDAPVISGANIVEATSRRYVKPFYTKLSERHTVNSRELKEWEYDGLRDLLTSPEVYIILDGDFYSATVEDNSVIRDWKEQDQEIFNMAVRLKVDNSELRQW